MKEHAVRLSAADALEAHGKFCIELKDPDTGKVKNRAQERNNVYSHLLNRSGAGYAGWANSISDMVLLLTDDTAGDYKMPFLLGKQIGCGWPSTEGSGALAILNRNEPAFYCVTPELFEYFQELEENLALGKIAQERKKDGKIIAVNIDDL